MKTKLTLCSVVLAFYAIATWRDLSNPEVLLSRLPAKGGPSGVSTAADGVAPALGPASRADGPGPFIEPSRDPFSYREAAPKLKPAARRPPPPPPPPPAPAPRLSRIERGQIEIHGVRERPASGVREVFLSVGGALFVARAGMSLTTDLRVKEVRSGEVVLETSNGDEEAAFSLP